MRAILIVLLATFAADARPGPQWAQVDESARRDQTVPGGTLRYPYNILQNLTEVMRSQDLLRKSAWASVSTEWDQYRLNETQRAWFKSVHNKQNVPCCDVADGHPTEMRRDTDGAYQIPDPRPGHEGVWLDVPATAMTTPADNPIGVATVWYLITGDGPDGIFIRCFVPESEA